MLNKMRSFVFIGLCLFLINGCMNTDPTPPRHHISTNTLKYKRNNQIQNNYQVVNKKEAYYLKEKPKQIISSELFEGE